MNNYILKIILYVILMDSFNNNEEYYYKKYLKYKTKYLQKKQSGGGIFDSIKNKVEETGKSVKDKIFKSLYEKVKQKLENLTLEDFILFVTTLMEVYDKLIKNDKIKDLSNINISDHKKNMLDIINNNSSNNEVKDLFVKLKEMVDSNNFNNKMVEENQLYIKLSEYTLNNILDDHKEAREILQKQKDILALGVLSLLVRTLTETVLEGDFEMIKKILPQIMLGLISSSKITTNTTNNITNNVVSDKNVTQDINSIVKQQMNNIEEQVKNQITSEVEKLVNASEVEKLVNASDVEKLVKEQVSIRVKELVEKQFENNETIQIKQH